MITLSLCMIVKNEEEVIGRCLKSISLAVDEIILVDTGSTDQTKEIAKEYTQNIYDFTWVDDFSKARNFAFSKAVMDYQLWLDADDVVLEEDVKKIMELKKKLDPATDIVVMNYNTHFDENGNPIFSSQRERIFKRSKNYLWQDPIHEYIPMVGNILYCNDISITHKKEAIYTDRNLKIYEKLENGKTSFTPRQLYYFARELKDHGQYHKAITYFKRFLETGEGWSEDCINACLNLSSCYQFVAYEKEILPALFQSFLYGSPRGEACCQIGYYYKEKKEYKNAADWFSIARNLILPENFCFIQKDYWDYIPCIELCVCWYNLNDIEKAIAYNEEAGKLKPESPAYLKNKAFFNSIKQAEKDM